MIPLVEMRGISKSFGPVQALHKVHLSLYPREVLGLVGDNAAGKSTLMKILTGAYQPDEGEIYLEGKRVRFASPHDSRAMGIEMVYQDLALAGNLSVTANVFLGREPTRSALGGLVRFMDERQMEEEAQRLLHRLRINIGSVRLRVESLSGGQRQSVAIGRATAFEAKVVIMDEPTAALAVREVGKVLELIQVLREHCVAVILISHRLQDVFAVADRIMVLRRGVKVGDRPTAKTNMDEVVGLMVGARGDGGEETRAVATVG
ncbi:MAG: sugar ABC transporter ATP-binding protein [Chloroflexi bacterium]|nr:sugar ABC transporter ATP-binding protein [Chloroflexota bacterium]